MRLAIAIAYATPRGPRPAVGWRQPETGTKRWESRCARSTPECSRQSARAG